MWCTELIYCIDIGQMATLKSQVEERGREWESPAWRHLLNCIKEAESVQNTSRKMSTCFSPLPLFCVPRSDLKRASLSYRWIVGCGPESERLFSEVVGSIQQNNGAWISSLFCGKEKNPDAFLLYSFNFFHWPPKVQGFQCTTSLSSSLRLLQLGEQAAPSINATHRINNRDLCKEKNSSLCSKNVQILFQTCKGRKRDQNA